MYLGKQLLKTAIKKVSKNALILENVVHKFKNFLDIFFLIDDQ